MKLIVGVADLKISSRRDDEIVTFALGSCLGITVYDLVAGVGGMVHVMLPNSSIDPGKAAVNPYMFVDTGVRALFLGSYEAGAQKGRLEVIAAGGACTSGSDQDDYFQIGRRNITVLRTLLWKNGILLKNSNLGGSDARTMSLQVATGLVTVRTHGTTEVLSNGGRRE